MSVADIPQIIQNLLYQTQIRLGEFKTLKQFENFTEGLILNALQANPQFLSIKDELLVQWRKTIKEQVAYWEKELTMVKQDIFILVAQGYLQHLGLSAPEERNIQTLQNTTINFLKLHSLNAIQQKQQEQLTKTQSNQQDQQQQQQEQLIMIPLEILEGLSNISYSMIIEEYYTFNNIPTFMKQDKKSIEDEIKQIFAPIQDAIHQSKREIFDFIRRSVLFSFLSPEFLGPQYESPSELTKFPTDLNAIISLLNYGNSKYGVSCYTVETIMFKKIFAALEIYTQLMQLHGFPGDPQWVHNARTLAPELGQIIVDLVTLAYGLRKTIVPNNKYLDIQMETSPGINIPLDYNVVKHTLDTALNSSNLIQPYIRYSASQGHVWVSAISNGVEIPRLAEILSNLVSQLTQMNQAAAAATATLTSTAGAAAAAGSLFKDINGVRISSVDILKPHFVAIGLPPNLVQNPDETAGNLLYHITAACHEAPLSYFCCPRADQGADIVFCMPSRRSQQQLLSVQVNMGSMPLSFAPCPTYSIKASAGRQAFPGAILWFLMGFCAGQPIVAVDLADMSTIRVTLLPSLPQQPHFVEVGQPTLHKYGILATLDDEDETNPTTPPLFIPEVVFTSIANGTMLINNVEECLGTLNGLAWDPMRWSRMWESVQKLGPKLRCTANVLVATTTYLYMMSQQRYIDQVRPPTRTPTGVMNVTKTWERIPRPDVFVGTSECIHFMDGGSGGNPSEGGFGSSRNITLPSAPKYEHTIVSVINQESLDTARQLKAQDPQKRVAVLNMANPSHPGGSWMGGYMAQEESLFLRSSLMLALDPLEYPLDEYDCYYSRDVTVFRDNSQNGYAFLPIQSQWKIDVASLCAVNMAKEAGQFGPKHRVKTGLKLFAMFNALVRNGVDTVVLGAFGCGILQNPPDEIAEVFKDIITFYAGHFDRIYFAIMDPNGGKIAPFIRVLIDPESENDLKFATRPASSITASNVLTRTYPALKHPLPTPVDFKATSQVCPSGGFCTNFSDEHFAEYAHPPPCPAGPGCNLTMAWHRAIFWHPKPCPKGMGCQLAGVPDNDPEALEKHSKYFMHPPACPEAGLCADSSDSHVLSYMHPPFCDEFLMFGHCSKSGDTEHMKSLRHYTPTPTIQNAYTMSSSPTSSSNLSQVQPLLRSPTLANASANNDLVNENEVPGGCNKYCGGNNSGGLPFCTMVECPVFADESNPNHKSHCAEYIHVCQYGQSCRLLNDPAHKARCRHMSKPLCTYWNNCPSMDDPVHRFEFHHKNEWDYLLPCPDGLSCMKKGDATHSARYHHKGTFASHDPQGLMFIDN